MIHQEFFLQLKRRLFSADPRLTAFVSYADISSVHEAAHCGVPTLSIPLFGERCSRSTHRCCSRCFRMQNDESCELQLSSRATPR